MRRCIGCGTTAPKPALVRLAVGPQGRAVIDAAGTLPGRGAYLCAPGGGVSPAPECLRRALRCGAIARALRARVAPDPKLVESGDRGEEARA